MENLSKAQAGNYTALVMLLVSLFKLNITEAEASTIVTSVLAVVAIGVSFYGRYKVGDLTLGGIRK